MLNSPGNRYLPLDDGVDDWSVDAAPGVRLGVLFGFILVPILVIAARTAYLQTTVAGRYIEYWERTREELRPLPCRNGRILSADGRVLAYDRPRYDVLVHYRWLEEPADPAWVSATARKKLATAAAAPTTTEVSPTAAAAKPLSKKERMELAKAEVLRERVQLWREIATVTATPTDQLAQARQEVQERVERIHAIVLQRRAESAQGGPTSSADHSALERGDKEQPAAPAITFAERAKFFWRTVVEELTTPPQRDTHDPLVIKEQLDYHAVLQNVPFEVVATIRAQPERFRGVEVRSGIDRVYPMGDLAAHIIGVRRPVTEDDLRNNSSTLGLLDTNVGSVPHPLGYGLGDALGRTGIERAYDSSLRGRRGQERIVLNRAGEFVAREIIHDPVDGQDLVLTFDLATQQLAERLLDRALAGEPLSDADAAANSITPVEDESQITPDGTNAEVIPTGGCLVALDIQTGELLAAAAAPRLNLSLYHHGSTEEWREIQDDTRRPLFPRLTQATVPPGSVFKIITAAAALDSGLIDPRSVFHCQGYLESPKRDRCYVYRHFGVGHGDTTLADALCQSCNVYFFDVANRLGPEPIANWARRFGLGAPTGIDLLGEQSGHVPSPTERTPTTPRWYPGTTRQLAIGQATLTVTPLQVARMLAAIANDGYLVTPRVVKSSTEVSRQFAGVSQMAYESPVLPARDSQSDPSTINHQPSTEPIPGLSRSTLNAIREGLELVVADPRGTGRRAHLEGVVIAGKTGTAEVGADKPDHAWFAGYFPADKPRVAFAVFLEHGGSGGKAAAPLAREFIQNLLHSQSLSPPSDPG